MSIAKGCRSRDPGRVGCCGWLVVGRGAEALQSKIHWRNSLLQQGDGEVQERIYSRAEAAGQSIWAEAGPEEGTCGAEVGGAEDEE
jgi:hypothetical protein